MTSTPAPSRPPVSTDREAYPDLIDCRDCGQPVPSGQAWTSWCESCGWNVAGGFEPAPAPTDPLARISRRAARRATERMHARLLAAPDDVSPSRTRVVAVTLAVLVLLATALVLAAAGWWLLAAPWLLKLLPLTVIVAIVWVVVPRPVNPSEDTVVLRADDHPRLHALVRALAEGMGVRPPARIWVSNEVNASVTADPWRRDVVLEIGLPLWCSLRPEERQFVLGHELGHLRGRDLVSGQVVWLARRVLASGADAVWPSSNTAFDLGLVSVVTDAAQRLLALPLLGAYAVLDRADAASSQRDEYLADRRSAALSGRAADVGGLTAMLGATRGMATAARAARTGSDPWDGFAHAPRRPEREVARLLRLGEAQEHVAGATHPPTHLRVHLVEQTAPTEALMRVHSRTWQDVERELAPARAQLRAAFRDSLLHPE